MPNHVTAATHERRSLILRHTRLLKLRSEGEIAGSWLCKAGPGVRLVVKQLAHTGDGDSPPVTNSTWIHTRHVRQIQTSLMLGEKNDWDFRYADDAAAFARLRTLSQTCSAGLTPSPPPRKEDATLVLVNCSFQSFLPVDISTINNQTTGLSMKRAFFLDSNIYAFLLLIKKST